MEHLLSEKRGLLILLVITTVLVFIGLVWAIVTYLPLTSAASPSPSDTLEAPRMALNCASPVAFWVKHPEYYPSQLIIAGKVYLAVEIKGIFEHANSDLPAKLQAQLVAAYLNTLSGAEQSYIQATMFEAYGWLVEHPSGNQLQPSDQDEGTRLLNLLEAYNLGQTGVAPCETAYLTQQAEMSRITDTPTPTYTDTPNPSETSSASDTPQPTQTEPYQPVITVVQPSKTPTRTSGAPIIPTQAPTFTRAPTQITPPTNTPKPVATSTLPPTAPAATPPPSQTAKP
jgi:hypothetical protein